MMTEKTDLFVIEAQRGQQNVDHTLYDMVSQLQGKELVIPDFQREFCWTKEQVKGWIDSILTQKAIGVVVTYQLEGGGATFLADGLQRLTATSLFIENPSEYGFSFGIPQAIKSCKSFYVTVQHRIYKDHMEAMRAFQKLNSGTSLTNLEFYMGDLSLIDYGQIIVDKIPKIIEKYELSMVKIPHTRDRRSEHKPIRDCYGLFLQYISGTDTMSFWDCSSTSINSNKGVVEKELARFITTKGITRGKLESLIIDFDKFIAEQVAEIRTILKEVNGEGVFLSQTMMRWLLHLSIWRKNAKRSTSSYSNLVKKIFTHNLKMYGSIRGRFDLPERNGFIKSVTLHIGSLDLLHICRAFDSDLYEGQQRARRQRAPGYHDSHIEPFSTNGNGTTFAESGVRNRARGARPLAIQGVFLND